MNNQDLYEFRMSIYERDGFRCQHENCNVTGADNLELGHRIMKGKASQQYIQRYLYEHYGIDYKLKYIEENYIHHQFNITTTCRRHNSNFNCFNDVEKTNEIIEKIHEVLNENR